ncbi:MAG: 2,4-dihydroxyhept-2-ene-1,7-dioic acid aldolase [Ignavibacteria bacterium RBG_16_34_14]|nr:MAG: 2,4-dihydroxyhept-2-ene-1,7-dioic acid aldolase [Ignavibacteria bacterium RBG_16_34_14]
MFKINKLKEKLKNNQLSIGSWVTLSHMSIPEIMATAGFDWLAIDMEHSVIEISEAQALISLIEAREIVPLVRVGENNPYLIKRVMDAGAYGVIVPMVNKKDDAVKAVKAVKYPPYGNRGVGLARAQKYGIGFEEYKSKLDDNSIVIVQIEHIDAVRNLDEIISVEGVDGCIIGPYDLSGSLGVAGQFDHPDMLAAIIKIEETCKKYKFPLGFHVIPPDNRLVEEKIDKGYKFIAFSIDFMFLGNKCRDEMKMLKSKQ